MKSAMPSVRKIPLYARMVMGLFLSLPIGEMQAGAEFAADSIVFYYGDRPAVDRLSRFDLAVVEPDTGFSPPKEGETRTRWFAYVSVGEVSRSREYYKAIPASWIAGYNKEWRSDVIDQTAEGWPEFMTERIIAPLWKRGYTGFFLDTLDSYQLVARDALDRRDSQAGLIAVIRAIRQRFPTARLILNRGFELLPATHEHVYAVAFESLFKGWSEARGQYVDVPEDDRKWLLDRVDEVKRQYGLPVIAIDYCPSAQYQCLKETVERIRALDMIPYVGDGRLQQVNDALLD
ncbi:uncharacterized protein (TIGR01370 family) [Paracandidimonas soli]|uniref:Uncharacterized protein (TIGR01370 family) n=2 Tax=Paracandidimonas soli TaxID=1917182 RepID=A0A4R3VCK2_9BURK|nr:uncharacterized protein (TIGR01370 family) [Paracandidimonas soli]